MKELVIICLILVAGIVIIAENNDEPDYFVKDYCQQNEYRINSIPNDNLTPDDLICVENNFFKGE
jgi:hypothetical protein